MSKPIDEPNASHVMATDFPHHGAPEEKLRFLLNYAVLAPSSHNTQPWLWKIGGNEIELWADTSRAMTALDASGRELIMSCGAALHHLRLAIRAFGYADLISLLPEASQPHLMARVRLAKKVQASADDKLLFRSVAERHTNRQQFEDTELSHELMQVLQQEAAQEGAHLRFVQSPAERDQVIKLIEFGTLVQSHDADVRRDQADWIAPAHSRRRDGIPSRALGISDWLSFIAPFALRVLDVGETQADNEVRIASNAPLLVVLCTDEEGPKAWLAAGQALSRVLLRARAAEVSASFFSQPIAVDKAWVQLRHALNLRSFPQLIFRLGLAKNSDQISATPRRAIDEMMLHASETENS